MTPSALRIWTLTGLATAGLAFAGCGGSSGNRGGSYTATVTPTQALVIAS